MGDNTAAHDVTLHARTGNALFDARVGDTNAPIGTFKVTAAQDTVFNDLVTVAHLETGTSGTTKFNTAKVVTTGPSSMVFGNDVVVSPASFTFDSTNDGLLPAGANITFHKTLGSANGGVSAVAIQAGSAGVVRLLGAVGKDENDTTSALKSLVVSAGGGIVMGGGYVETTGAQVYNNPLELSASVEFVADNLIWHSVSSSADSVSLTLSTNGAQALKNITVSGDLDVTTGKGNQAGGVSQAEGTSLRIGGASRFTAHTKQGQLANLANSGNAFGGAVSFLTSNDGSWSLVNVNSESALSMGQTTVDGPLSLTASSGNITQVGPLKIAGTTYLQASTGSIYLDDVMNEFVNRITVDTPQAFKLSATGPVSLAKVKVGQDAEIKTTGKLDLGAGTYGGKLDAQSGGFEIVQSGPITFFGSTNFDAGNAKIELFNPYNQWRGGITFKGGIILINHPVLMNAVNAGTLIMRAETSMPAPTAVVQVGGGKPGMLQPLAATPRLGPAVSVKVDQPSANNANGLITVALSSETAAPGRSFSFEIDPKVLTNQPADISLKVSQLDGKPLPDWLRYEADTKTFTAKDIPAGAFPLQLKVGVGGQETTMVIQEQDTKR